MGPLHTVHTPRLQRLMRGTSEPYLRPPLLERINTEQGPMITVPMGEYGASMNPRANPAFSDTWIVGATGGANRVVPQGIDYSRTPCCLGDDPNGPSVALMLLPFFSALFLAVWLVR